MVAFAKEFHTVADVMSQRAIDLKELVQTTGICHRIVSAIANQQYTPSPQQRDRIAAALRFPRHRIIWGHRIPAEKFAQARL